MNPLLPRSAALARTFPAILQRAGKNALFAADEFFSARLSTPHTRRAYARPVGRFLTWCEQQGIELRQVSPGLAGHFMDELPGSGAGGAATFFRRPGDTVQFQHDGRMHTIRLVGVDTPHLRVDSTH